MNPHNEHLSKSVTSHEPHTKGTYQNQQLLMILVWCTKKQLHVGKLLLEQTIIEADLIHKPCKTNDYKRPSRGTLSGGMRLSIPESPKK